jgi:hypothetical protein
VGWMRAACRLQYKENHPINQGGQGQSQGFLKGENPAGP